MAQEVTSKDFRLFIEEQKRTNEQLLLLKDKSSEETSGTLLVGELLKQIKQGDEESSTPAEYIKSALPEILADTQNTNRQINEIDEQDNLLRNIDEGIVTAANVHTNLFDNMIDEFINMNDGLMNIYGALTDQVTLDQDQFDFQKKLEFRKEREEARGDDEPTKVTPKEEEKDDKKKGGIFAVFGSLKTLLKGTALTIGGLYAFALALKNEEFNEQAKKTFSAIADSFDSLKDFFITISPSIVYLTNFAFKGLEAGFKGLETVFRNLDDFVKNGPEPETYAGLPSIASGLKLSITGLKGLTITKVITDAINNFKTSFSTFNTKIVKFFKPVTDTLTKTATFLTKLPVISQITSLFGKGGKLVSLLGKLAYPITIIQGAFSFATGFIDGFNEGEGKTFLERLQTALNTAVTNLVDTLVLIPIDFIIDAVGWVAGKLGFSSVEESLKDFSLVDFVADINTSINQFFIDAKNWIVTKISNLWENTLDLLPDFSLPKFELPGFDDIINFDLFGMIADKFRGQMKFLGFNVGDMIANIFDGMSNDVDVPDSSTSGTGTTQTSNDVDVPDSSTSGTGTTQTGQTIEEIALANSNLTKQQLDNIKALMNNNELLLDEMKNNQGGVNVVSGGNSINTYAKSDLTLSKSARSDDFSYNLLMAST